MTSEVETSSRATPAAPGLGWVLLGSGVLGFCASAFLASNWHPAVEEAQVLAGLVKYPVPTPEFQYKTTLWTLISQFCAVLLRAGLSERVVSFVLTGIAGATSFQALSVWSFVLGRNVLFSLAVPFLVHQSGLAESASGIVYPIHLMGGFAYGIMGLGFAAVALGVLAAGSKKLGPFLLALVPAVHPSWGVWSWMIAFFALLWFSWSEETGIGGMIRPFLAGAALTVANFAWQFFAVRELPVVDPTEASRIMRSYVMNWDLHRRPITWAEILGTRAFIINGLGAVLSMAGLTVMANGLDARSRNLLRLFLLSAALGLGALSLQTFSMMGLPDEVLTVMPGRWINMSVLMTSAVLFGLLSRFSGRLYADILTAFLAAIIWFKAPFWILKAYTLTTILLCLLTPALTMLRRSPPPTPPPSRGRVREGGLSAVAVAWLESIASVWERRRTFPQWPRRTRMIRWAAYLLIAASVGQTAFAARVGWANVWRGMKDWSNDAFYASLSRGEGTILPGPRIDLLQLRTRRPVLFYVTQLSPICYAPEIGPNVNQIMQAIFGLNLLGPPPAEAEGERAYGINYGRLHAYIRRMWEARAPDEWKEIGERFRVTEVVTLRGWTLQLPRVAENDEYALYRIGR